MYIKLKVVVVRVVLVVAVDFGGNSFRSNGNCRTAIQKSGNQANVLFVAFVYNLPVCGGAGDDGAGECSGGDLSPVQTPPQSNGGYFMLVGIGVKLANLFGCACRKHKFR